MKLIREEINMDISDVKPFTEMTSRELFVILTGGQGVMQQMYLLQDWFLNRFPRTALKTERYFCCSEVRQAIQ